MAVLSRSVGPSPEHPEKPHPKFKTTHVSAQPTHLATAFDSAEPARPGNAAVLGVLSSWSPANARLLHHGSNAQSLLVRHGAGPALAATTRDKRAVFMRVDTLAPTDGITSSWVGAIPFRNNFL